jgi:SAM-dependent methyltransferase
MAFYLVPDPDVLLVLDAPGEVMFARKGEHSAEILEGRRQAYLQLADSLPQARVLDAVQPQDEVQRLATDIVWHNASRSAARTPETVHAGPAELSLHLWRLLDWRFLLPVVQPKSLGYGGNMGRDMVAALHLLDPDAAPIGTDRQSAAAGTFDVVLLSSPDLRLFEEAAAAVEPGGWVCAQVSRSLFRHSGPRTLAGWKRVFEKKGFTDVAVYWHAPNLERTARIVPVASTTAIRDTLSLQEAIKFRRTKVAIARLALALQLFDSAIPEGTVMGRRSGGRNGDDVH